MDGINVFARIRPALCWEKTSKSVKVIQNAIGIGPSYNSKIIKPIINFYQFNRVFEETSNNQDIFNESVKSLCDNSININEGKDSIFITYGQTASGKTHTILGSEDDDTEAGVLQLSVNYLLNHPNVQKLEIETVESYGINKLNIHHFDLLSSDNNKALNIDEYDCESNIFSSKEIKTESDIKNIIQNIRKNAHFSATARHSKSNRGHIIYYFRITRDDSSTSSLLIVDLGGSDGKSAITRQFRKQLHPASLKLRNKESEIINYGLIRLIKFLQKYRQNNGLNKFKEGNIRTLLYPYFDKDNKPNIHLLFNLSPSITSSKESKYTLRNAKLMTNCSVIPERCSWNEIEIDNNEINDTKKEFNSVINELHQQTDDHEDANVDVDNLIRNTRKSILLKRTIDNETPFRMSQNPWSIDDETKQKQIILDENMYDDIEIEEMEKKHLALMEYRDNLQFSLMAIEQEANSYDDDDDDNDLNTKQSITKETRDSIQNEINNMQIACKTVGSRLSILCEIPLNEIMKRSFAPKSWLSLMDDNSNDDNGNDNDGNDDDNDEEYYHFDDINLGNLHEKQLQLVKYKKTLRNSLQIIKRKSILQNDNTGLMVTDTNYDDEADFIQKELQKVQQELSEIGDHVNKLNKLNHDVVHALHTEINQTVILKRKPKNRNSLNERKVDDNDDESNNEDTTSLNEISEGSSLNDGNNNNDNDNLFRKAFPRSIDVRNKNQTYNLIRRSIRCHSDLNIIGYDQHGINVGSSIISRLEEEKILKIVKIETGIDYYHSNPTTYIKFLVTSGEFAHFITTYKKRKIIEIFEQKDKNQSGNISIDQIKKMNLQKVFKSSNKQKYDANKFLSQLKINQNNENNANLRDFIEYTSILIHPLLKNQAFNNGIRKFFDNNNDNDNDKVN